LSKARRAVAYESKDKPFPFPACLFSITNENYGLENIQLKALLAFVGSDFVTFLCARSRLKERERARDQDRCCAEASILTLIVVTRYPANGQLKDFDLKSKEAKCRVLCKVFPDLYS